MPLKKPSKNAAESALELVSDDEEIEPENSEERIDVSGVGAELVRKMALERLQPRLKAFCVHGSLADIVALDAALELAESAE
jgi:hypothetical protein